MNIVTEIVNDFTKNYFDTNKIFSYIVNSYFKDNKLVLSESQKNEFLKKQETLNKFTLEINFSEDQIKASKFNSEHEIEDGLHALLNEDNPLFEKYHKDFVNTFSDIIKNTLKKYSKSVLNDLYRTADSMIERNEDNFNNTNNTIKDSYSEELKILKMVIQIATETFESINSEADKNNSKQEVITRIIGESCLVSNEILTLIENGYPDAALARWRNLYEQSVYIRFIAKNDNKLAQRFIDHKIIDNYKSMILYNKKCKELEMEPFSKNEIKKITAEKNRILQLYGKDFYNENGWAINYISINKDKKIYFSNIEEEAGLDRLRPYYKLACSRVHNSSKGMFFKMGLINEHQGNILYGPTTIGFEDPIQLTILVLIETISANSYIDNSYDNFVILEILNSLYEDIRKLLKKRLKE